jgi:hypothetical protein
MVKSPVERNFCRDFFLVSKSVSFQLVRFYAVSKLIVSKLDFYLTNLKFTNLLIY